MIPLPRRAAVPPSHTANTLAPEADTEGPAMPRITDPAPTDLLRIDDELYDEERLVRDTVRKFAADRIMPTSATGSRPGRFRTNCCPSSASSACSACT